LKKAFVGGERGFSAASSSRRCWEEEEEEAEPERTGEAEDVEGERTKMMNPNASMAARRRVTGFVRRILATAISGRIDRWNERGEQESVGLSC
jgi:hypothetical protein